MIFLDPLFIVLGFLLLIKSGDFLVEGSVAVANHFGMSQVLIGLTIVAFGTSAPELMVNVSSALNQTDEFIFGNVFGSNIINICFALGISGLITPIKVRSSTIKKEVPFLLFITLFLTFLLSDAFFFSAKEDVLSQMDAVLLLLLFLLFLIYNTLSRKKKGDSFDTSIKEKAQYRLFPAFSIIILSCLGLYLGSELVVHSASTLGSKFNIPKSILGLTVLAIGTSLPEIIVCIRSAQKGHSDITIGGIVGSNIFNTLLILGISALIYPPTLHSKLHIDLIMLNYSSCILFFFLYFAKDKTIAKKGASLFLFSYLFYIIYRLLIL